MLELIPSLLAAQTFEQAISSEVQADKTEVVAQEKAAVATPIPSVAPPETITARTLPTPPAIVTPAAASVPIREITFNRSSKPDIQTTPQAEITQPTTTTLSQPLTSTVIVKSKPPAPQKLSQPDNRSGNEIDPSSQITKLQSADQSVDQQANKPLDVLVPQLDQKIQSQSDPQNITGETIDQIGVKPAIAVPVETQPSLKAPSNSRPAVSDRVLERQKVLEKRLSEIVSKSQKEAQLREGLVTGAYESASQGNFKQARQSLKNPKIPATVQAEVVKTIRSLEVNSRKIGVTQATEPIRTALKQRQMEQRQQSLLRSLPSLPPLPIRNVIVNSSAVYPSKTTSPPVQSLTQPVSANSDPDYSVTNPPNLQAYLDLPLPDTLGTAQMLYPLPTPAPVTSRYGWRVHPVRGDRRFHAGVDLGAPKGTPVLATKAGKVKVADSMGGYGLAIVLESGKGKQDALYAHLSEMFVRPGEVLKAGTVIGRVGSTGLSTGPHLHYETRKLTASGWATTDPGPQLQVAKVQLEQALASARAASKPGKG